MTDIYETNAPERFPTPKEQPDVEEKAMGRISFGSPPIQETVNRWRKEVLDKILFLRENWEQTVQEKESLSQEVDRLQSELAESRNKVQALENQLSDTLENFNRLLTEVSQALEE
jgi:predicted  nucleic acid-binding Zn-ribbon protein